MNVKAEHKTLQILWNIKHRHDKQNKFPPFQRCEPNQLETDDP